MENDINIEINKELIQMKDIMKFDALQDYDLKALKPWAMKNGLISFEEGEIKKCSGILAQHCIMASQGAVVLLEDEKKKAARKSALRAELEDLLNERKVSKNAVNTSNMITEESKESEEPILKREDLELMTKKDLVNSFKSMGLDDKMNKSEMIDKILE